MVAPRYLLDNNVLSEPLKPRADVRVTAKLRRHRAECTTAAPVWLELWFGCERMPVSHRRSAAEAYLREVERQLIAIFPYDAQTARWHAREWARLQSSGKTPPFVDAQIAAIAAVRNLVLVTRNVADFERFQGLRLENWFSR